MKLAQLASVLKDPKILRGSLDRDVSGIAYDSRSVGPGMIFVAMGGQRLDGHHYLKDATERGAAAVVVENRWITPETNLDQMPDCILSVPDSRKALSALGHEFYGRPSDRMGMIGVTGTNGKTTTSWLIKGILESAGKKTGLIGTVGYHIGKDVLPSTHTTPESLDLHRLLDRMVRERTEYVVMEVSSHALALDRVVDCSFDVAVFTNLTQDHLDFHGDLEAYFEAKLKLFSGLGKRSTKNFPRLAVVNKDDSRFERVKAVLSVPCRTYAVDGPADLRAEDVRMDFDGIRFLARIDEQEFEVQSPLVGRYNISNLLGAIGAALGHGISVSSIRKGIQNMPQVPGRFEKIREGQDFLVVVDYAHTDAALELLLSAARDLGRSADRFGGRLITVFGCGGDRDRGKRPKMGRVAAKLSDFVIVTSDNPRTEDPLEIIKQIEAGILEVKTDRKHFNYLVVPDRFEAIEKAVRLAQAGDIVIIAGKGHEDYQIIGDRRLPFDDRQAARDALRRL